MKLEYFQFWIVCAGGQSLASYYVAQAKIGTKSYSLYSLLIVLFHLGTMLKNKNLVYHLINHDSSFSMLSYTYTNLFSREVILHGNRMIIHTISKMSAQMELSKKNNLILEIGLSKENRGNKAKSPYIFICFCTCML